MSGGRLKSFAVVGPTASGKSDYALLLARYLRDVKGQRPEIICCDSVQAYKDFDIGSAKPTAGDMEEFPHHLVDVVTWRQEFDAGAYAIHATEAVSSILARGGTPVFVGGTGLYLRAYFGQGFDASLPRDESLRRELDRVPTADLLRELVKIDPGRAAQLHPNDRVRILRAVEICRLTGKPISAAMVAPGMANSFRTARRNETLVVFLHPERSWLHSRIAERARAMVAGGLIDEVAALLGAGCPSDCKPMQSIGYRETVSHIRGLGEKSLTAINREQLIEDITIATRQYAKRQITWFKGVGADYSGSTAELDVKSIVARFEGLN